jgi:diacylglycerol kinase (ATP)
MICCTFIAALIGAFVWIGSLFGGVKARPMEWQLDPKSPTPPVRKGFSPAARMRSFGFAAAGIRHLVRTEHNAWLHFAATVAVIALSAYLRISAADWRWIVAAIAAVWSAEAMNTALEALCNLISPGPDEQIRIAKDLAAGAVLVVAIGAAIIGGLTLAPYAAPNNLGTVPKLCSHGVTTLNPPGA